MVKDDKDAGGDFAVVNVNTTAAPLSALAKKKPSSTPSFLHAAALFIRRYASCAKPGFDAGPNSPIVQDDDDGAAAGGASNMLKSIVDGMRPLHVQPDYLRCPPQPPPMPAGYESFHDVCLPPPSPDHVRSGTDESMSRYASAEDLQALDAGDDAAAQGGGASHGDNSVDAMAEEFIAKFYEQMRLQRLESMTRSNSGQTAIPE